MCILGSLKALATIGVGEVIGLAGALLTASVFGQSGIGGAPLLLLAWALGVAYVAFHVDPDEPRSRRRNAVLVLFVPLSLVLDYVAYLVFFQMVQGYSALS